MELDLWMHRFKAGLQFGKYNNRDMTSRRYRMIISSQPLPIQFEATSEEEFRHTIAEIQDTGMYV